MRAIRFIAALFFAVSLPAANLTNIDRTIGKEPSYQTKPKYCLLVFGEQATTKVWVVDDGDRIFVDRNANGDLTEAGEMIVPSKKEEFQTIEDGKPAPYRTYVFTVGNLTPVGKLEVHSDFKITRFKIGQAPTKYAISVKVNGKIQQFAGWNPIFEESREQAPVIHFGGSLIARAIRYDKISLSSKQPELHLCFGTPGSGKGSFGFLGYEAVPKSIQPVAEIQWPGEGSDLITTVPMLSRC